VTLLSQDRRIHGYDRTDMVFLSHSDRGGGVCAVRDVRGVV